MPIEFGSGAFNPFVGAFDTAKKIAAPDDHGDLNAARRGVREISRETGEGVLIKSVTARPHQGFAGELDDDAPPCRNLNWMLVVPKFRHGVPICASHPSRLRRYPRDCKACSRKRS